MTAFQLRVTPLSPTAADSAAGAPGAVVSGVACAVALTTVEPDDALPAWSKATIA